MKLLVGSVNKHRKPPTRKKAPQRFGVSRLKGDIVDDQGKLTTKEIFQDRVAQRLKSKWKNEGSAEEKWSLLTSTLCEAAESTLGKQTRRNPDWQMGICTHYPVLVTAICHKTQIGLWRVHLNLSHCLTRGISYT